ncbi:Asp-tRNA(Asn)/Glu-tRNA(Gln) amidotransferase subunit GatB [Petroclostridium sp. X23]|uniref:Asp-tRNA(Asn)/Glu-tRNA(Gln) amidotransferase subunit GatB n=1 Tax=Petroclostridium sp. X23 TaxID=3045146 RepID=UPI0024AD4263|nr:Asp-tRNA(Asn)/Glu-tRNA(Gln) amidotransferase subunit GatB [Petroclostridium sp. X23]WHH59289.1 Asp-tRNA(Asn)/Glu-tRNA(Gln) amidotransferase subunit GatB [Petroclostridium sp. X23]
MTYETVIGLEVHAELSTKTKIFCDCTTEFGGEVNTHCCPICTGMPGVLPMLNKKVVDYAIKAGLATNCEITQYGKQDRKNYFYPDLPKAYQISQYDLPVCKNGYVDIEVNGEKKRIGITRIHIEEDAGKLIHDEWGTGSLVDYNRCGVPLIEIVTEPDMRNPEEARALLETLKSILQYIDVSDCKMQEGSLRCDINLSVRPFGQKEFGTRTEMKNVNSFRAAVRAMEFETKRQIELVESGGVVEQETRRWDDAKAVSYAMRSKEEAHDYRYFPDPDLVPIVISDEWIEEVRKTIPELPNAKRVRYVEQYGLPQYDAEIITSSRTLAQFFEECVDHGANPKTVSNWLMGDLMRMLKDRNIEPEEIPFPAQHMSKLIALIEKGTISGSAAKKVLDAMFDEAKDPEVIVKEKGLVQISDESALVEMVQKVLDDNPQSVADYKAGKEKAIGFLVGQTMKASRGKANPQVINKILKELLDA